MKLSIKPNTQHSLFRKMLFVYTFIVLTLFVGSLVTVWNNDNANNKVQAAIGDFCDSADDCYDIDCAYPETTYCTGIAEEPDGISKCTCRAWNNQPVNGCEGEFDTYEPPACPSGYDDCGTSYTTGSSTPPAGCQVMGSVRANCLSCGNPSIIYRFCRQTPPPPPPPVPGCYEQCTPEVGCSGDLECQDGICVNPEYPEEPDCTPPDQPELWCGDGICQSNEYCERTSAGANTFRTCLTRGQPPTGAPVARCRQIQTEPGPTPRNQCTFCGDGETQDVEECDYNDPTTNQDCNLQCQRDQSESGISIDKTVLVDRPYEVGEQIHFTIRVTNTGDTTLNVVRFTDRWDPTYLAFVGGNVRRSNGGSVGDIRTIINSLTNSQLVINDLTTSLGDLEPNQYYEFDMIFTAVAPTPDYNPETCNTAIVEPDDLPPASDRDCVPIDNRDTDV